ncbi:valyl-tRNAsynthetase, mitochondrial, related [Neospora caninum Liverpool]|uniref:valine--tRNA ligase n=1 Tax=Neospora caninum (strain Liverpool) TaxID=572307 RepID=F0V974_NEOCL|nr:valyl-tRNAsynthetase, mitochondrial, related [Neospora caninum Liverpool]CBZ50299.1 valyl-tRNAsynthetase, mitochondrial, related [Neospora caninum Liverpool]CEL64904.1 TPA: Valyl-tRNA synthetase, mitochondrial, related [Neospora caninum Liverpool]|eukprot:XP_003880333.1 valyl-tRNAsynthetase, mitochondrial, related [Neospora caninum Liverpool]
MATKKNLDGPMAASYQPEDVEKDWYAWWEHENFFSPTTLSLHQRQVSGSSPAPVSAELAATTKKENKFVMVIPPPNVTGSLHIGHTLTVAIEDSLARWHRMNGKIVLWIPGADHAGIATQSVVERALLKQGGPSRHELGREAFLQKVWDWKNQYGGAICNQLRRVGSSVSWPHFSFTLDEKLSRAVVEAFVRMYDAGLIYREERLVSWSPYLKTAISDIEVDVEEIDKPKKITIPGFEYPVEVGYLWHFAYEVEGGGRLEVATTRIETMLGDVAVAVNPNDERYTNLVGRRLIHPFFPHRDMRVVADEHVVATFGTGAVKITPAHDKNDYAIAKRHNLQCISVFTLDGKISQEGGPFAGQHRFECRFKIQQALKDLGLLGEKVPNTHAMQLPRCSRSGDIIEYMLIPQWWCACTDMAARAVKAVRNGDLKIVPAFHEDVWYHWLENIKDWCISRQLWWGHRIPAYRVTKPAQQEETWIVGRTHEEALERAAAKLGIDGSQITLVQDEDVLDTWFSSGLFPFSVFGWPDLTQDMQAFFPTTLLETGHDILFFWVARMVMMSLQLTDKLPFDTVFLHAMVRDAHGQKMSKSKGNVIDPLEVISGISLAELQAKLHTGNLPEKEIKRAEEVLKKEFPKGIEACGCDALRLGLLAYTRQGRNVNLDLNRVVGYRHFCNKLWNATKFAMDKFESAPQLLQRRESAEAAAVNGNEPKAAFRPGGIFMGSVGIGKGSQELTGRTGVKYDQLEWVDRWILHRLSVTCTEVKKAFHEYAFSEVVTAIFNFFLYDFCDYYLELSKQRLTVRSDAEKQTTRDATRFSSSPYIRSLCALEVLHVCLDRGLRLLHPLCPFITEELFQRLPAHETKPTSICIADYPQPVMQWTDYKLDDEMELFKNVVSHFRSLIAALDIPPKIKPVGYVMVTDAAPGKEMEHASSSLLSFFTARVEDLAAIAKMSKISVRAPEEGAPDCCVSDVVSGSVSIFLSVEDGVNLAQTLEKMNKKKINLEKMIQGYEKKEAMPAYEEKVPADVREQNSVRKGELQAELMMLLQAIDNMKQLSGQ